MAARRGFETLRDENRGAWEQIWKGRIKLVGADQRWQALADAAYFYLHASAHSSSLFSTSMFGLAYWPNYHYYRGHVMWDIESFAFPTLLLTAPEAAHALLAYRVQRVQAAQRNAAMHGYRGLQFPWASGPRHGEEAIRLSAPQLVFEQHVSLSVALAFARMVGVATNDVVLTRGELDGLMRGLIVSQSPPTGSTEFSGWLDENAADLGRRYESELRRNYRRPKTGRRV